MRDGLPSPTEFSILSLLANRSRSHELTGLEIAEGHRAATNRALSFGTMYSTLRRLKDEGLVVAETRWTEDGDKVRVFKLTGDGVHVLNHSARYFGGLGKLCPASVVVSPG